jgi:hypothetical protein
MAGYSSTPLLQKLGVKHGDRVLLRNAPDGLPRELREHSEARPKKHLNVALLFATTAGELIAEIEPLQSAIEPDGMIWVAWPKKASGVKTDITEGVIRDYALKTHLVDVKVCAIDETWSGLKLVIRKKYRATVAVRSERKSIVGIRTQET